MNLAERVKALEKQYDFAIKTESRLSQQVEQSDALVAARATTQMILQHVAQEVQNQVHSRISAIVTRCLSTVFGEDAYEFDIQFEMKRGKTEAKLQFVRDGESVDPLTASGGGVVDVAAFALRLAALVLTKPHRRRLLVLDEPFRFVSSSYREKVRQLIITLSEELGIQIIMVTHDPALQVGNVVEIE